MNHERVFFLFLFDSELESSVKNKLKLLANGFEQFIVAE